MPIRPYNDTWQFYVRQTGLTSRRSEFNPYFINYSLYNFLNQTAGPVLDIGCGENNLSLFFPTIHGIDRTIESDTFGFITDDAFDKLPQYDYGIAVNSLHWNEQNNSIHDKIQLAVSKCKNLWISLNENEPIEEFKDSNTWEKYGTVKYFWHGQNLNTKQLIQEHLKNDHSYTYMAQLKNRTVDDDVELVYNNTVLNDPYYGVVRVIIQRND